MEATHQHHDGHDHAEHDHGNASSPPSEENWNNEEFVAGWLQRQAEREPERRRQFVTVRALIPKTPDQEFSYINLGAGPGNLDAVLLAQFTAAQATLVDSSLAMLNAARQRLAGFGDRVEFVQADLGRPQWAAAVAGPFDVAVASIAIHHAGDAERIRALYTEIHGLLGHGGIFLNLEYVRPPGADLAGLARWAAQDPEAHFSDATPRHDLPGTMTEHLDWLSEAGFATVDAVWKNLNVVCFCAIKDHLHLPEAAHEHTDAAEGHV